MTPMRITAVALLLGLAAPAAGEEFPRLQPLDQVLSAAGEGRLTEASGTDLQSRAAALQRRARALRDRPVVDPATRSRMEAVRALPRD